MSDLLDPTSTARLEALKRTLDDLAHAMLELEERWEPALREVNPAYHASARNLLHYLAFRRRDLRALQAELAELGLSSLGRAESHALFSVNAVLAVVGRLCNAPAALHGDAVPCDLAEGTRLLNRHTVELLGAAPAGRTRHIMVTMPTEAASDYLLVRGLLESGMTCMRINCAHDSAPQWLAMIEHLQRARVALDRDCSVLMDLGGPKLRTGEIEPGPAVRRIKPSRDALGRVTAPARIWLTDRLAPASPPSAADGVLEVDASWLAELAPGQAAVCEDTRSRRRRLEVVDRDLGGVWAELTHTAYFTNGTRLQAPGRTGGKTTEVSGIPDSDGAIPLRPGDLLVLTRAPSRGRPASCDSAGRVLSPARVSCTLPEVFADVRAGDGVGLDDGAMTGVVEAVSEAEMHVRILRTPPGGARLKSDNGINLPDSRLRLPALTGKDRDDLKFVVEHADMVGLSFASGEQDVADLMEAVAGCGGRRPGIVLKIETRRGFQRLPAMLLTAMRHDRVGVMIARGDLAIECGYERLAEVQEEMLWICEAAHCPVIWATQVLESLARKGIPSRAEITDAAMGHRAECVMLNKGPHTEEALRVLVDIFTRMDTHQLKKRAMLRALHLATEFELTVT